MPELSFDGRVAIVTGAGQGLGREHARLLAARGARVVVNDLGGGPRGGGASEEPARRVVEEIRAGGGKAVADFHSVATPEGARAIVETALATYGRLDVLVHNAGIAERAAIEEIAPERLDAMLGVHLRGGFFVIGAAWKPMRDRGYGRIVNVVSNAGCSACPGHRRTRPRKAGWWR